MSEQKRNYIPIFEKNKNSKHLIPHSKLGSLGSAWSFIPDPSK